MSLTTEERAEINRANASRSTGPRTDAGKRRARFNALKHGLLREAAALPHEDAGVVAVRVEAWNAFYRPASPAVQHLVNQCVRATLLSDRVQRHHDACLAAQILAAQDVAFFERQDEIAGLMVLLQTDPTTAVRRLKRTAEGCGWLVERWDELAAAFDARGSWDADRRDLATRLLGHHPQDDRLKEDADAFKIRLFNVLCKRNPSDRAIRWLRAERMPESMRSKYSPDCLPEPESCRASLREMIVGQLETLRELLPLVEECQAIDDDPAEVQARASVVRDEPTARLLLRYQAEARHAFQRSYATLVDALRHDRDGTYDAGDDAEADPAAIASPNEANPAAIQPEARPGPVAIASPNEARPATETASPNEPRPVGGTASPATSPERILLPFEAGRGRDTRSPNEPDAPSGAAALKPLSPLLAVSS